MKLSRQFAYNVKIPTISLENTGKCKSVTGQMPINIHVMSNQVTTPAASQVSVGETGVFVNKLGL